MDTSPSSEGASSTFAFLWQRLAKPHRVHVVRCHHVTDSGTVQLESGDFHITELPLRKWTQDYKEFLDSMVKPEDKDARPLLHDYK
jgi:hypothetical protein